MYVCVCGGGGGGVSGNDGKFICVRDITQRAGPGPRL